MSRVDQFESVFRAAEREPFSFEPVAIASVLVVTDLPSEGSQQFSASVRGFLAAIDSQGHSEDGDPQGSIRWKTIGSGEYSSVQSLLDLVDEHRPDLICTYRNLGNKAWQFGHTLGDHLEVLTQATTIPVLVMPHPISISDSKPGSKPGSDAASDDSGRCLDRGTKTVMAITDHIAGDDRLVNMAARFTADGGSLFLTHVEDQVQFDRYIDVIAKIPEISTDLAREKIMERLLKGPIDFIASCRDELSHAGQTIEVHDIVTLGHRLGEYESLVESHNIDLLVFHTKDDDQLAMHGLAYPLAVELRQTPLLMI